VETHIDLRRRGKNRYRSTHPRTEKRPQLFNLPNDPYEKANVAEDHPEEVARLAEKIAAWHPLKERTTRTSFE
jgi:hypothetical protein